MPYKGIWNITCVAVFKLWDKSWICWPLVARQQGLQWTVGHSWGAVETLAMPTCAECSLSEIALHILQYYFLPCYTYINIFRLFTILCAMLPVCHQYLENISPVNLVAVEGATVLPSNPWVVLSLYYECTVYLIYNILCTLYLIYSVLCTVYHALRALLFE